MIRIENFLFYLSRLVHKNVGGDQSNSILGKLEEDADVAYAEYDKAVQAEDRAAGYLQRVITSVVKIKNLFSTKIFCLFFMVKCFVFYE